MIFIRLENFLRAICIKVMRRSTHDKMIAEIIDIECELEEIFPPYFFYIMTHLPIHLADELSLEARLIFIGCILLTELCVT